MKKGRTSPLFNDRLKYLYKLKGINVSEENRGWAQECAKSFFCMRIIEYSTHPDSTEVKQINDVGRQLRRHINREDPPDIVWIKRYCAFFDCSADYLLGLQDAPRKDILSASEITGLSYQSIKVLEKISDKENKSYIHQNEKDINMLDTILSSYYAPIVNDAPANSSYSTIFRYMWYYIHSENYVTMIDNDETDYIYAYPQNDDYLSQQIPIKDIMPEYAKNNILNCLDKLK